MNTKTQNVKCFHHCPQRGSIDPILIFDAKSNQQVTARADHFCPSGCGGLRVKWIHVPGGKWQRANKLMSFGGCNPMCVEMEFHKKCEIPPNDEEKRRAYLNIEGRCPNCSIQLNGEVLHAYACTTYGYKFAVGRYWPAEKVSWCRLRKVYFPTQRVKRKRKL